MSRVRMGDDFVLAAFLRDLTPMRKRDEEREELYREQAARAEAERVTDVVRALQLLVDAALAHGGSTTCSPSCSRGARGAEHGRLHGL